MPWFQIVRPQEVGASKFFDQFPATESGVLSEVEAEGSETLSAVTAIRLLMLTG